MNMKPTLLLLPGRRPQMQSPTHGRIVEHHLRQLRCLSRMAGKLMSCAAMVWPPMPARVLLREESLGHDDEEIDVQRTRADGDARASATGGAAPSAGPRHIRHEATGRRARWRDRCARGGSRRAT